MRLFTLSIAAYGAAIALSLSPWSHADAQDEVPPAAVTPAPAHGDWTLNEREHWLNAQIDKSRDDGSLDRVQYDHAKSELMSLRDEEDHMRSDHGGELTSNENAEMEARLDDMAAKIHWANANAYHRPW